jgi:hypothetical protein
MSKDRSQRYEVMAEIVAELEGYVPRVVPVNLGPAQPDGPPTPKPPSSGAQAPVPPRRRSHGELRTDPRRRRRR